MSRSKNTELANTYGALFLEGYPIKDIAAAHGKKFAAVYMALVRSGFVKRKSRKVPFVFFNGEKYSLRTTGYYALTKKPRTLLHRAMWEAKRGKIPNGMDVHHKDGDTSNNNDDNFELITHPDHGSLHMVERRQEGFVPSTEWKPGQIVR